MLMIRTTKNASRLVQLFGVLNSHSWSTVIKGGHSSSSTKTSVVVFSCVMLSSSQKEAVAGPTWVQSIKATRFVYVLIIL